MPLIDAVIGLVCKTGPAIAVTLTLDRDAPTLVDRRVLELCDGTHSRFVFHDARAEPARDARRFVEQCTTAVSRRARVCVDDLLRDLRAADARVMRGAVVDADKPFSSPGLGRTLASHSLVHAAEGDLYRGAVVDAFAAHGIDLEPIPRRDVAARAGPAGITGATIAALGRQAGPPWRREHKDAALAALATASLSV